MEVNRIIAYGCSYTAGDEILDHVHMGVTLADCNKMKQEFLGTLNRIAQFNYEHKLDLAKDMNSRNTWAGQLAQKYNVLFENRALPGGSLDEIYYALCTDISKGRINSDDLVVVGTTFLNRQLTFKQRKPETLLIGWHLDPLDPRDKKLINLFNDDYLVFSFFKTLKLITTLSSKINIRLQPIVANTIPSNHLFPKEIDLNTKSYADTIWEECVPYMLAPEVWLDDYRENGKLIKCGFGHPPVQSHTVLANKIYETFKL